MKNMKLNLTLLAIIAALASPVFGQATNQAQLIDVLKKADASQKDKFDACRELARVGTKDAVPVLAALLGDEKYSHMARFGLEPIPDPSVDDALRAALGTVKGKLLAGVINSIGARRDEKAAAPLIGLLHDGDADVAYAAATSLAKIGSKDAAAALEKSLADIPAVVADACLRYGSGKLEQGRESDAEKMFDALRAAKVADHIRLGAIRGAILAKGDVSFFSEQIKGGDPIAFIAALRAAQEGKGSKWSKALARELAGLPAEKQIPVLQMLGFRRDDVAAADVLALAKSGAPEVRLAAIQAATMIGDAAAIPTILDLAAGTDETLVKAARASLASFPGARADREILTLLEQRDPQKRRLGVDLVGQRRIAGAKSALMMTANDTDTALATAAIKVLGDMSGEKDIGDLVGLLLKTPATPAAETALASVLSRIAGSGAGKVVIKKAVYGHLPDGPKADVTKKLADIVKTGSLEIDVSNDTLGDTAPGVVKKLQLDYSVNGVAKSATADENTKITLASGGMPESCTEKLLEALPDAKGAARLALLRLVRSSGNAKALAAIRSAAADSDAAVKDVAQRALCDWPTADALPDLLALAKMPGDSNVKILALRGAIRLVPAQETANDKKAAALAELLGLAKRADEKKLALSSLGEVAGVESLAVVTPNIANAELTEEASLSAIAIAEAIGGAQAADALNKVVQANVNPETKKRAQQALGKIKK